MNRYCEEEDLAITEMEIATQQLQSAYVSVFNKCANLAKNPRFGENPSDAELNVLDIARERFDKAKAHMDKIANEIRNRIRP